MESIVTFEGIHNFRDMGGLTTVDGRTVKSGLLFRCGHLANATPQDIQQLQDLQVGLIFDYRDESEAIENPSPTIEGIQNIRIPAIKEDSAVKVGNTKDFFAKLDLDALMADFTTFYAQMAFDNPAYRALFTEVARLNGPLLHHCTAGKDRTGVGAALIYLLLGVDEPQIIGEYLLTNKANAAKPPAWYGAIVAQYGEDERLKALVGVQPELIQAVFDAILEKYPSYDAYFLAEFGIGAEEKAAIQAYYLD